MAIKLIGTRGGVYRATSLPDANSYTKMFWLRLDATVTNATFWRDVSVVLDSSYGEYVGAWFDQGRDVLVVGAYSPETSNDVSIYLNANTALTLNTWYHVAWVKNNSSIAVYVNGTNEANAAFQGNCVPVFEYMGAGNGAYSTSNVAETNFSIAFDRTYSATLNVSEIRAEMLSPTAVRTANLYSDSQFANSVNDDSGNGRHWVANGAPSYVAAPTYGEVGWAEFELPWGHTGDLSWAELQVPFFETSGEITWAELQAPLVATAGELAWGELETSNVATRGRISWAAVAVPFFPTAGQISAAWFELRKLETAGRISCVSFEVPPVLTSGVLSTAWLKVPKSYTASFALSNGSVDIYRAANLAAEQSAGQITHVDMTAAGVYYTEANDIIITAVHSSNNALSEDAVLGAEIGAQTTKAGQYRTTKGFLSADKFLQDESYYNEHTYVVRVAESPDRWKSIYKKVLHPAGFQLVGEFVTVMTPDAFALKAHDPEIESSAANNITGTLGLYLGGSADVARGRALTGDGGVVLSGEADVVTNP